MGSTRAGSNPVLSGFFILFRIILTKKKKKTFHEYLLIIMSILLHYNLRCFCNSMLPLMYLSHPKRPFGLIIHVLFFIIKILSYAIYNPMLYNILNINKKKLEIP